MAALAIRHCGTGVPPLYKSHPPQASPPKSPGISLSGAGTPTLCTVKVDETLSLEHVTRGRAKLGQGRRPPTRGHLKEVANATSDGILRLDLDVPDSGPSNTTLVTSNTVNVVPPKEAVKPLMPPVKLPAEQLTLDSTPEDLEVKNALMPPAKNVKGTEVPSDRPSSAEGDRGIQVETAEESRVGPEMENLVDAGENTLKVPVPPPKILSAKMTATWGDPASELPVVTNGNLTTVDSKENLQEDAKEMATAPTPPPKILSDKLRASMSSQQGSLEIDRDDQRPDDLNPAVNGMNPEGVKGSSPEEPVFRPGKEELVFQEQRENSSAQEADKGNLNVPTVDQVCSGNPLVPKTRSSSMGDLLTEPGEKPQPGRGLQHGAALQIAQIEKKVAYERERTEKLLQQVLSEPPSTGNGPPTNREALLSEAVERLRQATQVLQESKASEEPREELREKGKGLPRDLATLYRRSAP